MLNISVFMKSLSGDAVSHCGTIRFCEKSVMDRPYVHFFFLLFYIFLTLFISSIYSLCGGLLSHISHLSNHADLSIIIFSHIIIVSLTQLFSTERSRDLSNVYYLPCLVPRLLSNIRREYFFFFVYVCAVFSART